MRVARFTLLALAAFDGEAADEAGGWWGILV